MHFPFYLTISILASISLAAILITPKPVKDKLLESFIHSYLPGCLIIINNNANYAFLYETDNVKISINMDNATNLPFTSPDQDCHYIVIKENIRNLTGNLNLTKNFIPNSKYLIVLETGTKQDMNEIFLFLWGHRIYNAVIYVNKTDFYTWYPYSKENSCGKKANLVQLKTKDPFVGKIPQKLFGCELNVTWDSYNNSALVIDPFRKRQQGALIDILNLIEQKMDIKFEYLEKTLPFMGEMIRYGHAMTLVHDMLQRKVNIGIIVESDIHCNDTEYFDMQKTETIIRMDHNFVLPPRKKLYPNVYILNLYSHVLLALIIGTLIVACSLFKIVSKKPFISVLFIFLSINMQQSLVGRTEGNLARTMLAGYILYDICIFTAWQTGLSSILASPSYEPKITGMDELLSSDLELRPYYLLKCTLANKMSIYAKRFNARKIPTNNVLRVTSEDLTNYPTFASSMSSIDLLYIKNKEQLEVIRQDRMNTYYYTLLTEKGFPLHERINDWIRRIKEADLLKKLLYDYIKPKYVVKHHWDSDMVAMGLNHLKGAFYVLMVGYAISSVMFCFEVVYKP